jgi:diguanylate cyclase (GGDEF)-like protein
MDRAMMPTIPAMAGATPPRLEAVPRGADGDERLRLLGAAFDALPVGISLFGADGRPLVENPAAAAMAEDAVAGQDRAADLRGRAGAGPARIVERSSSTLRLGGEAYELVTTIDVTRQRQVEDELFKRAFFDDLTGLPNRTLIEENTQHLIETAAPGHVFALAFIDLDGFKQINDYYNHAVGDALLIKFAARLSAALRPSDLLARIGGDEFVMLLSPITDVERLQDELNALASRLKEPFFVDGHEIFASASIGVSLYPEHGQTYDTLRRNADGAMYKVKRGAKGEAVVFNDRMAKATADRMALEQRLRLAVRDRRFCCAYQPKVDLRTQEVHGVEVLLRWRDEAGEIHGPGNMIGLAVELGLIDEVAHLVLAETVATLDIIDEAFGPHVTLSLNVAPKQADDLAFMTSYIAALDATGCAGRFMLEITEEAFFAKRRFQADVLPLLREVGLRVSIDDFGVGYSSLAALSDITADELKIDRSFITDIHKRPRSQTVLKAVESLGHAFGMSIVAEGVETFEEVAYLQAATRIHCAQGFYFARPCLLGPDARRPPDFASQREEASPRHLNFTRSGAARGELLR